MLDAIKKAKLSTNATTAIIIVAALVYLGFAFNKDPASAAVQIIPVLGAVAGAIKIIHQGDVTEARATEAANTAVAAAEQSTQNNVQLVSIDGKIEENTAKTDATHTAVNSRMDELIARVERAERLAGEAKALIARAEGVKEGRDRAEEHQRVENESAAVIAAAQAQSVAPATIEVKAP